MKITSIETYPCGARSGITCSWWWIPTKASTAWAKRGLTGRELAVTGTIERRPSYTWLGAPWSIRSRRGSDGGYRKGRPREGSSHPITSHQPGGGLSEHAHGADR